jgi:hypothetical protein
VTYSKEYSIELKCLNICRAQLLLGGAQCVDWDGAVSKYVEVKYGVRQGSI